MAILEIAHCPHCKTRDFLYSGIQRGYGIVPDMILWTCKGCGTTLSRWVRSVSQGLSKQVAS